MVLKFLRYLVAVLLFLFAMYVLMPIGYMYYTSIAFRHKAILEEPLNEVIFKFAYFFSLAKITCKMKWLKFSKSNKKVRCNEIFKNTFL